MDENSAVKINVQNLVSENSAAKIQKDIRFTADL